jgi:hypothetical protein
MAKNHPPLMYTLDVCYLIARKNTHIFKFRRQIFNKFEIKFNTFLCLKTLVCVNVYVNRLKKLKLMLAVCAKMGKVLASY